MKVTIRISDDQVKAILRLAINSQQTIGGIASELVDEAIKARLNKPTKLQKYPLCRQCLAEAVSDK